MGSLKASMDLTLSDPEKSKSFRCWVIEGGYSVNIYFPVVFDKLTLIWMSHYVVCWRAGFSAVAAVFLFPINSTPGTATLSRDSESIPGTVTLWSKLSPTLPQVQLHYEGIPTVPQVQLHFWSEQYPRYSYIIRHSHSTPRTVALWRTELKSNSTPCTTTLSRHYHSTPGTVTLWRVLSSTLTQVQLRNEGIPTVGLHQVQLHFEGN